jgi:hypothetical protein
MGNKINAPANQKLESIVKHNYYGFLRGGRHRCGICVARHRCNLCHEDDNSCEILKTYATELSELLYSLPHITDVDAPLVEELIHCHCRLLLLRIYYAAVGEVQIKRDRELPQLIPHPIGKMEAITRNQVLRLSEALGLTPDARRRMAKTKADIWDVASRAAELRREKENAI